MNANNTKVGRFPSGGDYVSPELIEMAMIAPEIGFASSDVEADIPAKWVVGNEDWWND